MSRQLMQAGFEVGQGFIEQAPAQLHRFGVPLVLECVANGRASLGGNDEIEPGQAGAGSRSGDNFQSLATFETGRERCQVAVDTTGDAVVTDIGVYRIGKIDHCGPLRQLHDIAAGRENVDIVREQVVLDVLDELQRVTGMALHLEQTLDPLPGAGVAAFGNGVIGLPSLIEPVGGNAIVGHGLHFAGADLHLDGHAVITEQGGMQALVAVGLGDGDVVLEAPRYRLVEVMDYAENTVAAIDILSENAKTKYIHDFSKRLLLVAHLFVNRQQVFLASDYAAG